MGVGVTEGALIIDTGLNNSEFIRDANQFRRAVEGLKGAVDRVGKSLAGGADGYLRTINQASGVTRKLDAQIKQLEREAARLQQSMSAGGYSDSYNALSDSISKAEAEIEKLQAKQQEWADMGIAPDSAPFEELDQQIFDLMDSIEALKAKQAEMRASGDALAPGMDQMKADYAELQQQLEALKAQRDRTLSTPPGWDKMATVTGTVADAMNRVKTAAATAMYALQHPLEALNRGFASLIGGAIRAASAIAKMAGRGAVTFLRQMAEGARNAAIQFAKLASNAVRVAATNLGNGFKTLGKGILAAGKWMLGLNHSAGEASNGFKRGLWSILKYGLGIRSLYFLFRKVRTAISEGLGAIAKRNPVVNQQLKAMKGALNGLKGSLAAAFAPIFSAVAPALTYLINMLTSAINAVAAFMAALTGQRTYQRAVAGINAAGNAANSAGNAADGASESYRNLKRELAGFDDLDILESKDSGGSGRGGGITYSTEEISSGITDFITKLKELWENADYEGVGQAIAACVNQAFETAKALISWDNLGQKITEAVNAITRTFNGMVDAIDWNLIGETFGEGANTIINTLNLALTGIDWQNLGHKFAEGLNGLVNTVDWTALGQLFSNKMNALIGALKGLVENFSWGTAARKFAEAMNSLITGINWENLVALVTGGLNNVISALRRLISEFDWSYAATAFANTLNGLMENFDWAGMVALATEGINKIISALRRLISEFDWSYAATAFANTMNGLMENFDWAGMVALATEGINKIISALRRLISEFDWSYAATAFANTMNGLMENFDWAGMVALATEGINKIISALRRLINEFDWSYAGTAFANTLNGLISGINWQELGETAAAAIAKPLEALKTAVQGFSFGDAATAFAEVINGFFSNEQLWADAGETVSTAIKGLFTWGAEFLEKLDIDQISSDIKLALANVDWPGIAKAIWDFLVSAAKALGKTLVDLFSPYNEGMEYEVNPYTGELVLVPKAGEGLKDNGDGTMALEDPVDGEAKLNFGLNLADDDERKAFEALNNAIQEALETGEWVAPVGLGVSDEAIEAARQNFIERWNREHPEAPIDPTLPDNAGQVIEDEWAASGAELETEVDLTKGEVDPEAQNILDAEDQTVTTEANLEAGTIDPDAKLGVGAVSKTVTTKESLVNGTIDADAKTGVAATDKTVTTKTNLSQGTIDATAQGILGTQDKTVTATVDLDKGEPATVDGLYSATDKKVVGKTQLTKADTGNQTVSSVYSDGQKKVIGKTQLDKANEGNQTVSSVYSDGQKKVIGKTQLDKADEGNQTVSSVYSDGQKKVIGKTQLTKADEGNQTVSSVYSDGQKKVIGKTQLDKGDSGKQTVESVYTTGQKKVIGKVSLKKAIANQQPSSLFKTSFSVTVSLIAGRLSSFISDISEAIKKAVERARSSSQGNAAGGIISNGGALRRFAGGGVIRGGMARYLSSVPHYAGGSSRAHGTVFVAGEAGPEVMGHINGRTEILNKSQIAQAIYSAVVAGMGQAVNALGVYLANRMGACTDAITGTLGGVIGGLDRLASLSFHAPALASGGVLPYEVAAQVARAGADIQSTLDANNEELIQTIIQMAGQIVAAVQASGRDRPAASPVGGLTARQVIDEINRRTQMMGASPLQGV